MLSDFYDFLVDEVNRRYKQKYPITKNTFVDQVVPLYSKYVVDLVSRICADTRGASNVPRLLDLIAFEGMLLGRSVETSQLVLSNNTSIESLVLAAEDFIAFADRAGIIDFDTRDALRNSVKQFVSPLDKVKKESAKKDSLDVYS